MPGLTSVVRQDVDSVMWRCSGRSEVLARECITAVCAQADRLRRVRPPGSVTSSLGTGTPSLLAPTWH